MTSNTNHARALVAAFLSTLDLDPDQVAPPTDIAEKCRAFEHSGGVVVDLEDAGVVALNMDTGNQLAAAVSEDGEEAIHFQLFEVPGIKGVLVINVYTPRQYGGDAYRNLINPHMLWAARRDSPAVTDLVAQFEKEHGPGRSVQ